MIRCRVPAEGKTCNGPIAFSVIVILAVAALAQAPRPTISDAASGSIPSGSGMYVQTADGFNKILGQIVSFQRTGSLVVSSMTLGIKTRKVNVQLLAPHAQTVVGGTPVFYFIPPKQAADAGVNAGDFVLIRLEEKPKRRQFEIGAQGAGRASSGISITHQIQLSRSEAKPGIYTITPAIELGKGEYALYLARGEGMQAYVYDFTVSSLCCTPSRHPDKGETASPIQFPPTTASAGVAATRTKTDNESRRSDVAKNPRNSAPLMGEATAEISSDPLGADIEIDGDFVGSTPSSVGLLAGEHTLRVSKTGYKRWERTLKTSTGNIKVVAALEPIPAVAAGTTRASAEIHQEANPPLWNELSPSVPSTAVSKDDRRLPIAEEVSTIRDPETDASSTAGLAEELIGVSFTGSPTLRHDGIEVSGVRPKGPADNIGIRPGDVILDIDGHYLFTIDELRAELLRHQPGARLAIRYRHNRLIFENYLNP
jgi:PEGA domain/PDZ domain